MNTLNGMTKHAAWIVSCLVAGLIAGCIGGRPGTAVDVPQDARAVDVKGKLEQRPISIVEELLIGERGVEVQGRVVRIRGSNGSPLWVVDGMYMDSPVGLNPRDVERMWIVPTGAGYGRRGGNGVVIIETRKQ